MASNTGSGHAHLDATEGRTVVFCHNCHSEWYEDEEGQELCPRCHGEIIEIVSPDNDPRELYSDDHLSDSMPDLHPHHHHHHHDDSDPEEADIDDHIHHGPGGFRFSQRAWDSGHHHGAPPRSAPPQDPHQPPGAHHPGQPDDGEAVMRQFLDMVSGFGMNRMAPGAPFPGQQHAPPPFLLGGGNIRRTTFTSPDGRHTTSVTFTTGPVHFGAPRLGREEPGFPNAFRTIFGGLGPPPGAPREHEQGEGRQGGNGDPQFLVSSLQELLAFFTDPSNARRGDAVYSQEALDRIISNLMEANPQSNAAPPASESALAGLQRQKMDATMLEKEGGKAECTVCIDEIKVGEEVVFLPCKHWFHDACVVMWLREHNTCPICRTSIEPGGGNSHGGSAGASGAASGQQGPRPGQQSQQPSSQQSSSPQPNDPASFLRGRPFGFPTLFDFSNNRQDQPGRPAGAFPGSSTDPWTPLRPNPPSTGSATGVGAEREQRWANVGSRRSSMSPPSTSDHGSRTRTRSPSTNSRRSAATSDQEGQSEGPRRGGLGWFREHFGRGSDRDRRRP